MRQAKRALIIGGSVGGLLACALFRQRGWDAVVFERARGDLAGRGAGLGITGELVDIMDVGFACAYLATPYARRLSGETLFVDGGVNIMA